MLRQHQAGWCSSQDTQGDSHTCGTSTVMISEDTYPVVTSDDSPPAVLCDWPKVVPNTPQQAWDNSMTGGMTCPTLEVDSMQPTQECEDASLSAPQEGGATVHITQSGSMDSLHQWLMGGIRSNTSLRVLDTQGNVNGGIAMWLEEQEKKPG